MNEEQKQRPTAPWVIVLWVVLFLGALIGAAIYFDFLPAPN